MNTRKKLTTALAFAVLLAACAAPSDNSPKQTAAVPAATSGAQPRRPFEIFPTNVPLPSEGFDNPPESPFRPTDDVIRPHQMRKFYGPPGEFGYYIDGADYGFKSLSFILTETHPGGGPNLHTHETEEAHILLEGKVLTSSATAASPSKGRTSRACRRAWRTRSSTPAPPRSI